jgi:predicted transcriptional regulator
MAKIMVTVRLDPEIKEALQKMASKDHRNLSDFIRLHLEKLVETSKKK